MEGLGRRRDLLLALVAPVVLLVVALIAVVRHVTFEQSPWQGVGFGMFSSYDYLPSRSIRATATTDGRSIPIRIPDDLRDHAIRARVAPGDSTLPELAEELRRRLGADRVRVQVLGHRVSVPGDRLQVELVLVREVTAG